MLWGTRSMSCPCTPGPQGWELPGDSPKVRRQQRRALAGLHSLFLEEAGTFGKGRCFLPEGQHSGETVRGVRRKEGRVEEHGKSMRRAACRSDFGLGSR